MKPPPISKPRIAITMGDPCGVGPEIIVQALAGQDLYDICRPVVVGDERALQRAVRLSGRTVTIHAGKDIACVQPQPGAIELVTTDPLSADDINYGAPTANTARATIGYIELAARAALGGQVEALCTCPIHKANLHRHGFEFPGHTEFLSHLTKTRDVVMMLAGPRLRVALVTIHEPLAAVAGLLDRTRLKKTIAITGAALLRDFGLTRPRVAVAALNPHAGEGGRFGREELDIIGPVLADFAHAPFAVSGPYAPDTVFYRAYGGEFDAVIAMYHDQGLIPLKLVHFQEAVNITLGLPIIRTSVDHGTAYDLAGTGKADARSLEEAIRLAALIAANRRRFSNLST